MQFGHEGHIKLHCVFKTDILPRTAKNSMLVLENAVGGAAVL